MSLVMELETRSKGAPKISERHRVLIAAAVSAVVGSGLRIPETNERGAGRRKLRPFTEEVERAGSRAQTRWRAQGAVA